MTASVGQAVVPEVGSSIPAWVIESVSAEKMKTMAALLDDSNPIHFDVDVLRQLGMGERPVNQGPSNLGYVQNMLIAWAGPASLRRIRLRFLANVQAGDRITASGTVTEVRQEHGSTLLDCDVQLDIEGAGTALAGTATVVWPTTKEHA